MQQDDNFMFAKFLLENNDTITIEGNSVPQIFFELHNRFPEGIYCKAIGFSGKNQEDSSENLRQFLAISKRNGLS